jgi:hypothetical protein
VTSGVTSTTTAYYVQAETALAHVDQGRRRVPRCHYRQLARRVFRGAATLHIARRIGTRISVPAPTLRRRCRRIGGIAAERHAYVPRFFPSHRARACLSAGVRPADIDSLDRT